MQVDCKECGSKSRITSRNKLGDTVSDLYCQCTNVKCGHTFVMTLSFNHTITPSATQVNQFLFEFVKNLPPEQKKALLNDRA